MAFKAEDSRSRKGEWVKNGGDLGTMKQETGQEMYMCEPLVSDFFLTISRSMKELIGKIQTISCSVNFNGCPEDRRKKILDDLSTIVALVGSRIVGVQHHATKTYFPHGSIDLTFENGVLARYVFVGAEQKNRSDWHIYSDKCEFLGVPEENLLEIIETKLYEKTKRYAVNTFSKAEKKPESMQISFSDIQRLLPFVEALY